MKKNSLLLWMCTCIFLICSSFTLSYKNSSSSKKIKWLSFEEAIELQKKDPKLIMVDVYMDNCPYCNKMERQTFAHPKVKEYLTKNFYMVKLNAFGNKKITMGGKEYRINRKSRYKTHELAEYLLRGNMQFPSTVFIDENQKPINSVGGYMDAGEFDQVLQYYGKGFYKKIPWGIYLRNSKPRF